MPIHIRTKTIIVLLRDIDFFVLNTNIIRSRFPKSVLARCHVKQLVYKLNDDYKKQLNALYPNFSFNSLTLLTRPLAEWRGDSFTNKDMILFDDTKYNQLPNIKNDDFLSKSYWHYISNSSYYQLLNTPHDILFGDVFKDLPKPLTECDKIV